MTKVSIQEFKKMDLRVGEITNVAPIQGTDNLLKVQINLGERTAQSVAGLRPHYEPEELKGQQVVVITNLQPAEIQGVTSEVMMLAAVTEGEEKVSLISPSEKIALGTEVR